MLILYMIDPILLDRLEIIDIPKYTKEDRIKIIKEYFLKETEQISYTEGLITGMAEEENLRNIKRLANKIKDMIMYENKMNRLEFPIKVDYKLLREKKIIEKDKLYSDVINSNKMSEDVQRMYN